ncbi:somatostatin-2-like [Lepisosteus oculatus]|uniref:somatostatin-2-like n=1 Tax=Lepisosteus oculatus TaxID=7918 RepID=UPI00371FFE1B
MHLLSSLVPLALLVWSLKCAAEVPSEERQALQSNGGLAKERKDVLLKVLSGLLVSNLLRKEQSAVDSEQLKSSLMGERSVFGPSVPRERTPCKNFFWKTFSSC